MIIAVALQILIVAEEGETQSILRTVELIPLQSNACCPVSAFVLLLETQQTAVLSGFSGVQLQPVSSLAFIGLLPMIAENSLALSDALTT